MQIEIQNQKDPNSCPNCGTQSKRRYQLTPPGSENDTYTVCPVCVGEEINKWNRGFYSLREWRNNGRPVVDRATMLEIIDAHFVNKASGIRAGRIHASDFFKRHQTHRDMAEELVSKDKLSETTVGVDDALAYQPCAARRLELIKEYNLRRKWDTTMNRYNTIIENIEAELGRSVDV